MTNFNINAMVIVPLCLTCGAASAATITPGATDNIIAFEAEIGAIDNIAGSGSIGWEVNVGTSPASPSGGSYVTNTENITSGPPINTLTYSIDFQKTGTYTLWYRAGYTQTDFQDNRNDAPNNDSFYYESGPIGDATKTFTERNGLAGLSTNVWTWYAAAANDITVGGAGVIEWVVSNREDGLVLDRFALVHQDESATVDAAFLDGLANTPIPEPSSLALLGLGGLLIARRRR